MTPRRGLPLLVALLLWAAGPAAAPAQQGTVRGRVVDASTGEPVFEASVRVLGTVRVTFTDAEGRFLLAGVPSGLQRLSVERLGYAPQRIDVPVPGAGAATLEIALELRAVAVGELVVSPTKREQSSFDSPMSISVQEVPEIRRRNPESLDESVAYVPSVQFIGNQLNIRGSSGFALGVGTRVLLMMDGISINAVDTGELNWDMIPLTAVERVEVLKGAGSALYGTSALGGVVNVVTARVPDETRTSIRLRGGFYDNPPSKAWIWSAQTLGFGSAELTHARRLGPVGLWLQGGLYSDDGYIQNGEEDRVSVALRLGLGQANNRLRLFGTFARQDHGTAPRWCIRGECEDPEGLAYQPARIPAEALDDKTRSEQSLVYATYERAGRVTSGYARASWQRNDWRTDFGDRQTGAVSDRLGGELRFGWQALSQLQFTLGGEGAYSDVDSKLSGRHDLTDAALYLQAEASLGRLATLTAGARADVIWLDDGSFSDSYSDQLSPRFGLVLAPDAVTRVRGSVGRGFNAPTIFELFTATEVGGFRVVPNPNLRPERSWAGEVGVARVLTPWLSFDVAAFFYDFDQLIEADTVIDPGSGFINVVFMNLPESTVQGVEAIGRLSFLGDRLNGQVAFTLLDSEDKATGEPLPYRPDQLLTATGNLVLGTLELGADWRFASAFGAVNVFTDERLDPRVPMRVLDVRLAYRIGRQTLRFSVDNAANYGYNTVERNLEPIRRYTTALELEF